jgi:hypothetical protein
VHLQVQVFLQPEKTKETRRVKKNIRFIAAGFINRGFILIKRAGCSYIANRSALGAALHIGIGLRIINYRT